MIFKAKPLLEIFYKIKTCSTKMSLKKKKKKNCLSKFIENTQTIFTYLVFDPSKSTERNRKLMPWIICIKLTTTINLTISIITLHSSQSLKFSSQRQKKKKKKKKIIKTQN